VRAVSRLEFAEQLSGWPDIIPRTKLRGVKALGGRYEAAVAKQLGRDARKGVWWSYRDSNGPGLCQTDFIILGEVWAVILECKHTWTAEGMAQLRDLYIPVVGWALNKKVLGVQVCKHLVPHHTGPVYNVLEDAVNAARTGDSVESSMKYRPSRLVTLHWRGIGPMLKHVTRKEPAYG
jgi:hypothetical protein